MDIEPDDGSIFLTGHTLSGTENWDTYTMKIDSSEIYVGKVGQETLEVLTQGLYTMKHGM